MFSHSCNKWQGFPQSFSLIYSIFSNVSLFLINTFLSVFNKDLTLTGLIINFFLFKSKCECHFFPIAFCKNALLSSSIFWFDFEPIVVICFGRYIFVLGLPKCSFLVYIVLNKFPIFVKIHFYLFQKKCMYIKVIWFINFF